MTARAIQFRQEVGGDGRVRVVVVGGWPDETRIATALLDGCAALYVKASGRTVRIEVSNGHATYLRTGADGAYVTLRKISGAWEPVAP